MLRRRFAGCMSFVLVVAALGCKKKDAPPPGEAKTVSRAEDAPAPASPAPAAIPAPGSAAAPASPAPSLALQAPVDIGLPKTIDASAAGQVARIVWQNLDKLKNGCASDISVAEFPEGTARTFGCSLFSVLPYGALAVLSGKAVFVGGPHAVPPAGTGGAGGLVLTSRQDFGRYNPEFVQWAVDTLVPGASDAAFRLATQPLYDRYVRPLARVFLVVRAELDRDPARFGFERRSFKDGLAADDGAPQRYAFGSFLSRSPFVADPGTKEAASADDFLVDNVAAFWLRRHEDQTAPLFAAGLDKLMTAYDAEFAAKAKSVRLEKSKAGAWTEVESARYLRYAWEHLAASPYNCPGSVTYELGETGLRAVWCHLNQFAAEVRNGRLAGQLPYLSGQPNDGEPVLDRPADFGHYNPAFVKWLADTVIPAETDATFRKATQQAFDANLRYVARTYWVTWTFLQENPELLAKKVEWFKQQLAARTLPRGWYEELDATLRDTPLRQRALDAGYQANETGAPHVGGALAFWLRRAVDGTGPEFARGLEKLLKTYDPAFVLALRSRPPDVPAK